MSVDVDFPSDATEEEREYYTTGSCHVLAIALARTAGMRILVVTDREEDYWTGEDGDDSIPAVIHCYALDAAGIAWDALGGRPLDRVRADVEARWGRDAVDLDDEVSEAWLRATYVDDPDAPLIDRPLHAVHEEDVAEACEFVRRALARHWYPAPAAP